MMAGDARNLERLVHLPEILRIDIVHHRVHLAGVALLFLLVARVVRFWMFAFVSGRLDLMAKSAAHSE